MSSVAVTASFVVLTLAGYLFFRRVYERWRHPLLNVVLLTSALIVAVLVLSGSGYESYEGAKNVLGVFMGPATVALALPLYRYRRLLRAHALPVVAVVAMASLLSMLLAGLTAQLGGMPQAVVISVLPKGISTPFAVEIADMYGGVPSLATAFVIATGIFGAVFGRGLLDMVNVREPIARGLALGLCYHAMGTVAALEEGEVQGAMAGLAMILAGLCSALFAPLLPPLLRMLL